MLVLRFVAPMLGDGGSEKKGTVGPRVLVPLALLTVVGFVVDQMIHGRFI